MDWPSCAAQEKARNRMTCFVRVDTNSGVLTPVSYYRGYQPAFMLGSTKGWSVNILDQIQLDYAIRYSIEALGNTDQLDRRLLGADIVLLSRLYRRKGLHEFVDAIRR
jgi:hypothetical protein